jgi:hypothetical protein
MKNKGKSISLLLILLLAISVGPLIIKPTNAQSIPKPAVPEFTVNVIHSSGFNGTLQYDNITLVIAIKNQQFNYSINGTLCKIFYDIRIKYHSYQDWEWAELCQTSTYYEKEFTSYLQEHLEFVTNNTPAQSNSEYSIIPLTYYDPSIGDQGISYKINTNATIDIQVKAYVAHSTQGWVAYQQNAPCLGGQFMNVTALDSSSNWSSTQTITIPAISTSPSPTIPNSSPTVPEFPIITIVPLLGAITSTIIILKKKMAWRKGYEK